MGFSKATYRPNIQVGVMHPYYPQDEFVFTLAKEPSKAAKDADAKFVALVDSQATLEEFRKGLIEVMSEVAAEAPSGFEDFPVDERPLPERMREYFDAPEYPELEMILAATLRQFRISAQPVVYIEIDGKKERII